MFVVVCVKPKVGKEGESGAAINIVSISSRILHGERGSGSDMDDILISNGDYGLRARVGDALCRPSGSAFESKATHAIEFDGDTLCVSTMAMRGGERVQAASLGGTPDWTECACSPE